MVPAITAPDPLDINALLNPSKSKREVSADISGNGIGSSVKNEGDKTLFQKGEKQLGKQDFLQLLVTQLRFQDPMEPQENTEFVAQLAQFSSLEGTQNINESIDKLTKNLEAMVAGQKESALTMSNSSATGLIGKHARVLADTIIFDPTQKEPIKINVHVDPGEASVLSVLDEKGNIINALPLDHAGESTLSWNGAMLNGDKAPAGKYTLKVTTRDGSLDMGYAYLESKVEGIRYTKDGVRLQMSGQEIAMSQVVQVGEPPVPKVIGPAGG